MRTARCFARAGEKGQMRPAHCFARGGEGEKGQMRTALLFLADVLRTGDQGFAECKPFSAECAKSFAPHAETTLYGRASARVNV
eukprot:363893-Chlamydomonas_euryale.AAC.11